MLVLLRKGNCLDLLADMPAESVDCVFADPPYGQTSLGWDKPVPGWPAAVRRVLKPTGSMWVCGTLRHFMAFAADFAGWRLSHDVVWEKHNGAGFFNDRFRGVHETIGHFYRDDADWSDVYRNPQFTNDATARTVRRKGKPSHWTNIHGARKATTYLSEDGGPRLMRSVIYARSEHGRADHPTQKPLELVEPLLLYACPKGGHVLDPFAGSGTVGLAARRNGMEATLMEANEEYWPVIEHRLQNDAPLLAGAHA